MKQFRQIVATAVIVLIALVIVPAAVAGEV